MMKPPIVIRPYDHAYQQQVVALILHIQQEEYQIPITKEDQPDLLTIEDVYQKGNGNFWIALCNDQVVGTISLLHLTDHQVALKKMFVHEAFRGDTYGTARLLLQTAIQWAKQRAVEQIYLGTTPQFLAAHRFYEKHGFVEIPQQALPKAFPILHVDKKFYRYIITS